MKKALTDNNIITARAKQAILNNLHFDQKTLRIIGKVLEPNNLKRIGIAAGGSVLNSMVSTLGRERINRAETARKLSKQLMPLQKKVENPEVQNAALLQQNEDLKSRLSKLEPLCSSSNWVEEYAD